MLVNLSQDRSARSSSVIRVINKCRLAADMKPGLAPHHQRTSAQTPFREFDRQWPRLQGAHLDGALLQLQLPAECED